MSNPRLHTVKSCPEKSRPIKNGHHMHSVINASYCTYIRSYIKAGLKKNLTYGVVFAKTVTIIPQSGYFSNLVISATIKIRCQNANSYTAISLFLNLYGFF